MNLRPDVLRAEKADYPALVRLWNSVYPEDDYTADEFYHLDTVHKAPCKCARFVVKDGEAVVAASSYMQFIGMYHPQKFMVNVFVAEDSRRQGLGGALYAHLLGQLKPFDPVSLRARVRESAPEALRFAETRGFEETKRDWQAVLELANFDPAPYAGLEPKLAARGVVIKQLVESDGDAAELDRRLHALFGELRQDVPRSEPATPIDFERFRKLFLDAPDFFRESVFLALDGDELIGMTMFWRGEEGRVLHTGLTGVRRPWRGQGVATALKAKALQFARAQNAFKVYTDNDTTNEEMIRVNAKLGFEREPAWISVRRLLDGASEARSDG